MIVGTPRRNVTVDLMFSDGRSCPVVTYINEMKFIYLRYGLTTVITQVLKYMIVRHVYYAKGDKY